MRCRRYDISPYVFFAAITPRHYWRATPHIDFAITPRCLITRCCQHAPLLLLIDSFAFAAISLISSAGCRGMLLTMRHGALLGLMTRDMPRVCLMSACAARRLSSFICLFTPACGAVMRAQRSGCCLMRVMRRARGCAYDTRLMPLDYFTAPIAAEALRAI